MTTHFVHRRRFVGAAAILLAASPAWAQRAARPATDPSRAFDAYATKALADWGLPGAAVAVVRGDSVVYARGFGVRRLGATEPVTPNTVFAIGSTTKAFTSAALGLLVDEGKVAWDDPVTKHLSGFQLYDPYVTRELTVRDLLTHRSGLARGDRLWAGSQYDRAEVLRRVRFLRPSWGFRSTYGYQNIMFLAAGAVVERAAGTTWDDFVQRRIFVPLGMTRSVTSVSGLGALPDVAVPHERVDGAYRPVEWLDIDNIGPAGSINSSVNDMTRWIRLQLGDGTFGGQRLIQAKTVKETHTPQMVVRMSEDDEKMWPMTHLSAYALGWSIRDYHGRKMVSHGGAIRGMRAQVTLIPEEGLGVVVLINGPQSSFPTALANRAVDLWLGNPERDWSAVMLAATKDAEGRAVAAREKLEKERVPGTSPSMPVGRYAGTYADSMYGEVRVREEGGRLALEFGPHQTGDLSHWHFDTYAVVWRNPVFGRTFARFQIDARGKVAGVELENVATFGRAGDPAVGAGPGR